MRHIFRWSSIDGVGTEYLDVDFAADGTVASGVVVGEDEGVPYGLVYTCLLYTSPSPRDRTRSRMPSSA